MRWTPSYIGYTKTWNLDQEMEELALGLCLKSLHECAPAPEHLLAEPAPEPERALALYPVRSARAVQGRQRHKLRFKFQIR